MVTISTTCDVRSATFATHSRRKFKILTRAGLPSVPGTNGTKNQKPKTKTHRKNNKTKAPAASPRILHLSSCLQIKFSRVDTCTITRTVYLVLGFHHIRDSEIEQCQRWTQRKVKAALNIMCNLQGWKHRMTTSWRSWNKAPVPKPVSVSVSVSMQQLEVQQSMILHPGWWLQRW